VQEQHDDSRLSLSFALPKGTDSFIAAAAGSGHDDTPRPFFQFMIGRFDIDHQIPVDFTEADHRSRRQHI